MEQVIGPTERGELATSLINACESYGTAVPLIIELSRIEIMATVQEGRREGRGERERGEGKGRGKRGKGREERGEGGKSKRYPSRNTVQKQFADHERP